MEDRPKLYGSLASWFHLITAPEEYEEEAEVYRGLLEEAGVPRGGTVLELGSGGGNNASHLKAHFEMTLADLSPEMLDLSKSINSELEHVEGDMRTLRLGREFDGVFLHDAIDYMTTEGDLRAAMETAFLHCRPGGTALFVPDHVRESFKPSTEHGGTDADGRGARYLQWAWDPDPSDDTYLVDFAYLLRNQGGEARVEHDRHVCGLFSREVWLRLLTEVGFTPEARTADLGEAEPSELFLCRKA